MVGTPVDRVGFEPLTLHAKEVCYRYITQPKPKGEALARPEGVLRVYHWRCRACKMAFHAELITPGSAGKNPLRMPMTIIPVSS